VCNRFIQRAGIDYYETFAAVAKGYSFQVLIEIAAILGLQLEQMNVVTVFLNRDVKEEIYIQVPEGMELPQEFLHLTGLKQATKLWNDSVYAGLKKPKFTRCDADPCLHMRRERLRHYCPLRGRCDPHIHLSSLVSRLSSSRASR